MHNYHAIKAAWHNLYQTFKYAHQLKPSEGQKLWDSVVVERGPNEILVTANQKLFDKTLSNPLPTPFSDKLYELFAGTPGRLGTLDAG